MNRFCICIYAIVGIVFAESTIGVEMRLVRHQHHHHAHSSAAYSIDQNNSYFLETDSLPGRLSFTGDALKTPIDTKPPLSIFPRNNQHPFTPRYTPIDNTLFQTNKFYTNLYTDLNINQGTLPVWSHPYTIWYTTQPQPGLAISQTTASQRAYGHNPDGVSAHFVINPAGIQSLNFGAAEVVNNDNGCELETKNHGPLNVDIVLIMGSMEKRIEMPVALGMGLITIKYFNLTPKINGIVGVRKVQKLNVEESECDETVTGKWEILLFNQVKWTLYAIAGEDDLDFILENGVLVGNMVVSNAILQVAPSTTNELFDLAAGAYPTSVSISSNIINPNQATYSLNYKLEGNSSSESTVLFALPHHVAALTPETRRNNSPTGVKLDSTVFGQATATLSSSIEMNVELPDLGWVSGIPNDAEILSTLSFLANKELAQDISGQTSVDSMYYAGKAFDKFAHIIFVAKYITGDVDVAKDGLDELKDCWEKFATNNQQNPLVYDTTWKGIVSSAGLDGDYMADFGNTFYSDHHFHYGYFIHAAAMIAQLDKDIGDDGTWLAKNRDYVNNLIRDVANPSQEDGYFPTWRCFDWYTGKSWAKGLFSSGDGKDEESTSEDYHFLYGMMLWGRVNNDPELEARASLMLGIEKMSINSYFLYTDDNTIMPPLIKPNKVAGILFENKIDYATYFGLNTEYIHGIQMIPMTPATRYIRTTKFVQEEWDAKLSSLVSSLTTGWLGILKQNQALINAQESINFFKTKQFEQRWLDYGMSQTWALAFAAGLTS